MRRVRANPVMAGSANKYDLAAVIGPATGRANGAAVIDLLGSRPIDPDWAEDLRTLREMPVQERSWDA